MNNRECRRQRQIVFWGAFCLFLPGMAVALSLPPAWGWGYYILCILTLMIVEKVLPDPNACPCCRKGGREVLMATHRCPFCKSTIPESKPAADLPVYSKAKISEQSYKGFVYLAIGRIAVTWGTPLFFYVLHRFGIIRNRDAAILGVVFVEHFVWFYSYFLDYCLLERSVVKTAYHCPNCGESAVGGRLEYLSGNCCSCGARLYSDRPSLETGEIKSLPGAEKFQRWRRCLEFLRGVVVKLPAILMIAVGIIAIYGGFSFKGVIGISLLAFALAGMIKSKICKFLQRKAKKELHCPYCSTDSNTNSAFAIDMAWLIAERCPSCGRKLS